MPPDEGVLFLTEDGHSLPPNRLTQLVREYVTAAETGEAGRVSLISAHDRDGDARERRGHPVHPEMLEHVELSTTQIYTQVSIRQLKAVHALTHPSAKLEGRVAQPLRPELTKTASTREELFSLLAAEGEEERLAEDGR